MALLNATTNFGEVSGVPCGYTGYSVFKGIPYASPPVGSLRWAEPIDPEPWTGTKVCDVFPKISVQNKNRPGDFYQREFFPVEAPMSEDCLYLNIWTPAAEAGEKLPVMVWIHGGAYMHGYGHEIEFDGEAFCRRGVILVTINYRLGIMGYFAHPELSQKSKHGVSGNYGLLDQIQALKWVKSNIGFFGGDPENVTVFGQSAGGGSVLSLSASPFAKGLFQKAIIQSIGGVSSIGGVYSLGDAEDYGKHIVSNSGLSFEEFSKLTAEDALEKANAAMMTYTGGSGFRLRLVPCMDGYVLPRDPGETIASGEHHPVPYMTGSVTGDSKLFGEREIDWLKLKSKDHPLYVYNFCRDMPGGDGAGAFHSAELWYIFGTLMRCWRPLCGADYDLSLLMTDYWTSFAKNGNPNSEGNAEWPDYTADRPHIQILDI